MRAKIAGGSCLGDAGRRDLLCLLNLYGEGCISERAGCYSYHAAISRRHAGTWTTAAIAPGTEHIGWSRDWQIHGEEAIAPGHCRESRKDQTSRQSKPFSQHTFRHHLRDSYSHSERRWNLNTTE